MAKKIIEQEIFNIPYSIPQNWVWGSVEDCFDVTSSKRVLKADWKKSGVPFYRTRELVKLSKYGVVEDDLFITEEMYEGFVEKYGVPSIGDILVSGVGTIGIPLIIKDDARFYFKDGNVIWFKNKGNVNEKYVYYLYSTVFMKNQLDSYSSGTTVDTYTIRNARKTLLPLPPLPEQERIVNRIESLFEKIDKAEALINEAREGYEKRKGAILAKAFRGELTKQWRDENWNVESAKLLLDNLKNDRMNVYEDECLEAKALKLRKPKKPRILKEIESPPQNSFIPNTWVTSFIYEVGDVELGGTPSRKESDYWDGDIPWISSGEVANNEIYDTKETITQIGLAKSNAKLYPIETVLIAMIGEGKTRGQSSLMKLEATTNQNVAGILCNHQYINSRYIWYYLQYTYEKNRNVGRGGNQPALNGQKVGELIIDIAPYKEQCRIVNLLDECIDKENRIHELCDLSNEIESLRKSILAKAFRGLLGTNKSEEESFNLQL